METIFFNAATLGMYIAEAAIPLAIAAGVCYCGYKVYKKIRDMKTVKKIRRGEINATQRDEKGRTQLMFAESVKECEALIEKGADINAIDKDGNTALMHAIDPKIISWLVAHGAEIDAVNNNGQSALMQRAMDCDDDAMEILLRKGAKGQLKDDSGKSVLECYIESSVRDYKRYGKGKDERLADGSIILNRYVLESLSKPVDNTQRETVKKTLLLQGKKGHMRVDACQEAANDAAEQQVAKDKIQAKNPPKRRKQANINPNIVNVKTKGA